MFRSKPTVYAARRQGAQPVRDEVRLASIAAMARIAAPRLELSL